MSDLPKLLSSSTIIRFQDCDPYKHLNNIKYLEYFINAREDQVLEAYDLDIYNIAITQGVGWVTAQNQIAYIRAAVMKEKVEITSKIIQFAPRAMSVEFQMLNADTGKLKSIMWSKFVHIDMRTGKSLEHNAYFMEMFTKLTVSVDADHFEARVKAIRAESLAQKSS
ncbi:MAG: acyl-CoA thioesterase [Bacteroidetes bacterium]|nr:MAG: acyl-CoA thioesterase [Bacteroidota bacterium]